MHRLTSLATGSLLALLLAAPVAAHFGGEAFILVPGDHVNPGQTFEVIVADLTPGARVDLIVLENGDQPVPVGSAVSDTQGHFSTTGTLPADFPNGYVEIVATAEDGTSVSTWMLVGPRTSETGAPPVAAATDAGLDPSLIMLGVLVGGAVGAVGYVILRRRWSVPAQAPAPQRRERVPSKSSRRPRDH